MPSLTHVERSVGGRHQLVASEQQVGLLTTETIRGIGTDARQATSLTTGPAFCDRPI
ncbi:MAG: hypothetical protein R2710_18110 [Acidimicrobiales bacterium]